jgi:hypothetical protein
MIEESLKKRAKRVKTEKGISTIDINDVEGNFIDNLSDREVK